MQILTPILGGDPLLQQGGSKNSLKPRAGTERRENKVTAGYLRDRDFDYDPPGDLSRPTLDSEHDGTPLGWRWCRHEIENYLIDPAVVSEALPADIRDVEEAIRQAAASIRSYEAVRWTIGIVRRDLPPQYELKTRPDGLNEIDLPPGLEALDVNQWALESIEAHRRRIVATTEPDAVRATLDRLAARFDGPFIANVADVLLWFSGKDLLAGMADWLHAQGVASPGAFRAKLRDWVIANPVRALELLPERSAMIDLLRAAG